MKPVSSPPRLLESDDRVAQLLRDAQGEYEAALDPAAAWQRRRARSRRLAWSQLVVPSFAFAAAVMIWLVAGHRTTPDLVASAEPGAASRREVAAPASAMTGAARPTAADKASAPLAALKPLRAAGDVARPASSGRLAPAPAAAAASEPPVDCLALARAGDVTAAERCFETQAARHELSAEVALYELARLRRDVLAKPAEALGALDQYVARFPSGSLIGEVRFSRLELLLKLNRSADVLRESEQLLSSPSGAERAAEIHFLRGNVFKQALRDPARAAAEYGLARGAPGRLGDESAFQEGLALEQAGDTAGAHEAFRAYVLRASPKHRAEAELRLKSLGARP